MADKSPKVPLEVLARLRSLELKLQAIEDQEDLEEQALMYYDKFKETEELVRRGFAPKDSNPKSAAAKRFQEIQQEKAQNEREEFTKTIGGMTRASLIGACLFFAEREMMQRKLARGLINGFGRGLRQGDETNR